MEGWGIFMQIKSQLKVNTSNKMKNSLHSSLRIQSMDLASNAGQKGSAPKRSNSFYGTVVEQMLENVSSDISSTHYAQRRNSIRTDKGSPRKIEVRTEKFNLNRSMDEDKMKNDRIEDSPKSSNNESSLSPRSVFHFHSSALITFDQEIFQTSSAPCGIFAAWLVFVKLASIR